MKRLLIAGMIAAAMLFTNQNVQSQALKVGVFDLDLMVQAMPGYTKVDSLMQIYERDSLGTQYDYYNLEYHRLDSVYKLDSALAAQGKKSQAMVDITKEERRKMAINIVYWQQIAQNRSNNKRSQLANPLYQQVADAYKKILARKKYTIILKPQTYEAGFPIDNIFLSVARELKLSGLPQELLYLGDDPDSKPAPATTKPPTTPKK
jgi:hypothetical protein